MRYRTCCLTSGLVSLLLLVLMAHPLLAQNPDQYSRLGLSAAPDQYVGTLEIDPGDSFTLYVIAVGPQYGPLPFGVSEAQWAIWSTCCGQTAFIRDVVYASGMDHNGEPLGGVKSTPPECLQESTIMLAAVTFTFYLNDPATYLMGAGAAGPLLDCQGEVHLLMDLVVNVTVRGTQTPNDVTSWGTLKALYQ
jgi:hypothetical protein